MSASQIIEVLRDPAVPAWTQAITSVLAIIALGVLFGLERHYERKFEREKVMAARRGRMKAVLHFTLAAKRRAKTLQNDVKTPTEYQSEDWFAFQGHCKNEIAPYVEMAAQFDLTPISSTDVISAWTSFRVELARIGPICEDNQKANPAIVRADQFQLNSKRVDNLRRALILLDQTATVLVAALEDADI